MKNDRYQEVRAALDRACVAVEKLHEAAIREQSIDCAPGTSKVFESALSELETVSLEPLSDADPCQAMLHGIAAMVQVMNLNLPENSAAQQEHRRYLKNNLPGLIDERKKMLLELCKKVDELFRRG